MERRKCKGTRDLLPGDMAKFRRIEGLFTSCCSGWGYREVRTPTLEYLHLFTSAGTLTPSALGRVYSFLDWDGWSGERVVLRPDGTIPIARLCVDELHPSGAARLFYVENTFSFEESVEKSRERWQCGAELLGSSQPTAEVELILLALEVLSTLGFGEVRVKLSHAGLLRGLLDGLGVMRRDEVLDEIFGGNTGILLDEVGGRAPELREVLARLFQLKGSSPRLLKDLKAPLISALPALETGFDNFVGIAELLDAMGCSCEFDLTLERDFEYYTGIVFQFYLGEWRVGGGGRYDDLIPLVGGKDIPASGFALYLDRLVDLIEHEGIEREFGRRILVGSGEDASGWRQCFDAAGLLRNNGYIAELDLGYQGEFDGRWLLLMGSGKTGSFLLVDQARGERLELRSIDEIIKILGERGCG